MASNRIFYAVQRANVNGLSNGFQSISINASVDFEQVFELGCLDIYENLEGIPSAEVTAERALPVTGGTQWTSLSSAASSSSEYAYLYVMDDSTLGNGAHSPSGVIQASAGYVSSYNVNMPVDGFATDTLTIVCDTLQWTRTAGGTICNPGAAGNTGTNRVQYRNDYSNVANLGIQNVSFSVDIGREDLFELGKKSPFFRAATYPIEVTADFEVLANATASRFDPFGTLASNPAAGAGKLSFTRNQAGNVTSDIAVQFNGYNMGSGCRLVGTNYAGGDAGGGNATITFSYLGYNYLNG
jgi:hypothetical protein